MKHQVSGRKFDRPTDERLAMYRNMVASLITSEKMVTTEAKAKEIRRVAERIITLGKKGSIAARRQALAFIYDENVVEKLSRISHRDTQNVPVVTHASSNSGPGKAIVRRWLR